MKRTFRIAMVAILAIASITVTAPARAAAQAATGITFAPELDHNERTITFEPKLFLYPACGAASCEVTPAIVVAMTNNIDAAWNNDLMFGCYELVFDFQIQVGEAWQVPAGEVGVRIDRSAVPVRSVVQPANNSAWDASTPSARLLPTRFGSTWGHPPMSDNTYAHEFGHVLGLDDGYVVVNEVAVDRPGAPHDLMSTGMWDSIYIAQETVDKLMHRSGVREEDLRCSGWDVDITWTDTYDGTLDTIIFDGVVDTIPLTDEFFGISLIGEGTASGSRAGWKGCNPGIDVVPSGNVPATFLAIIDDEAETITISAYANFETALSGIATAAFTFDLEDEAEQTVDVDPGPPFGDLCPRTSYGTATIEPINPPP